MTVSVEESFAYCRTLARRTARNFYVSFYGLPAEKFQSMCALYAFMRVTDDLADDTNLAISQRAASLDGWQRGLERELEVASVAVRVPERPSANAATDQPGRDLPHRIVEASRNIFPALTETVRRFHIPHEYLYAVVEGVRRDLQPTEFATFDELSDYCFHVAGAVGLCCIHVWGFHDRRALDRAVDCGLAFQLTNILRDLGEDARMGRIYLPQEDLERFDYTAEDLAACRIDERFRALMQYQTQRARSYYRCAEELFEFLDPAGKPILRAMLRLYGGLLTEIERRDFDIFTRRISLPRWRKLLIAGGAFARQRVTRCWPPVDSIAPRPFK